MVAPSSERFTIHPGGGRGAVNRPQSRPPGRSDTDMPLPSGGHLDRSGSARVKILRKGPACPHEIVPPSDHYPVIAHLKIGGQA
ncbi:hypothetical protein GCM10022419_120800 [Nonomuraea rosea]|uniref:Uncharacterized protein n=1 Tax=Nonomuraea rosea TaxID=638574 RepID=A0ABP6ZSG4_9ACTN